MIATAADARLDTTLTVRAVGEAPTAGWSSDYEPRRPAKHLLKVEVLKVFDGETFKNLAEDCGIPWKTRPPSSRDSPWSDMYTIT